MNKTTTINSLYNRPKHKGFATTGKSLTRQEMVNDIDINKIMDKYNKYGVLPTSMKTPRYADVADIPDYHTALNTIKFGEEAFMSLDAKTRLEFNNDPAKLLEFIGNPDNREKATEMGFFEKPDEVVSEPEKVPAGGSLETPAGDET